MKKSSTMSSKKTMIDLEAVQHAQKLLSRMMPRQAPERLNLCSTHMRALKRTVVQVHRPNTVGILTGIPLFLVYPANCDICQKKFEPHSPGQGTQSDAANGLKQS